MRLVGRSRQKYIQTMKVLKNISQTSFETISYGKKFSIGPKGSLVIKDSQEEQIAQELLQRFGFLRDITPKPVIPVETTTTIAVNAKGRKYKKVIKVVRKARGVKKSK